MRKFLLSLKVSVFMAVPGLAQPVITQQPTNQIVLIGGNATFSIVVSGAGPFTYQWQFNETNLPNDIITTVAGIGTAGFSGDGGAATNAQLRSPNGAVLDASGNLFIADKTNHRIRKVDTNGIITTVAGTGSGFSGDGGMATNAQLNNPFNVAVDAYGQLLIADAGNNRIRKIDTNGIITTVAGGGLGGNGGMATNASISNAGDVAVDASGNIFIGELTLARVRKVNTNGIISTVAGGGFGGDGGFATNASLLRPASVFVDASGNLFIADISAHRVRKVDTNGIITTFAGNGTGSYSGDGGLATAATIRAPAGLAMDALGNVFISDGGNHRIRKVDTNGIINTVVGNGSPTYSGDGIQATNASIATPQRISLDRSGNLFISDNNQRIRKVSFGGTPVLAVNNVTLNNVGNYRVIVSNADGSVISSNATLTVLVPPNISTFTITNGVLNFNWNGQSNFIYQLQYATNLAAPDWQNLGDPVTATNDTMSASDIPGIDAQRFYRVRLGQ